MPDTIPVYQVDAFASQPFEGNPAAVCLLDNWPTSDWPSDHWLQSFAAEMNLSETAFLRRVDGGEDEYHLRWFTPALEVDLCGHATLASAHVLWTEGQGESKSALRFQTRSGTLTATAGEQGEIQLDFPAQTAEAMEPPAGMLAALGVDSPQFVGRNAADWLVRVDDESAVRGLRPDFVRLRETPARGIIATAQSDQGADYDFVSRFFAPAAGIDEDPVTGSAHCCLAPYWAQQLDSPNLTGFQASPRGGRVRTQLRGDRVILGGTAVTVLRGALC